jgi:hypothetical protein
MGEPAPHRGPASPMPSSWMAIQLAVTIAPEMIERPTEAAHHRARLILRSKAKSKVLSVIGLPPVGHRSGPGAVPGPERWDVAQKSSDGGTMT